MKNRMVHTVIVIFPVLSAEIKTKLNNHVQLPNNL